MGHYFLERRYLVVNIDKYVSKGSRKPQKKVPLATKLEGGGGGKAFVAGPQKKNSFLRLP